jgi:rhodanese-related sulfurtransferase
MAISKEDLLAQAKQQLTIIDAHKTKGLIEQGATLLDVREAAEFSQGHLPHAKHVSRGLLEFMVGNHPALLDPSAVLVVYCKNGGRSALAADLLQRMGFGHIFMLEGGYDGWCTDGHETHQP